MAGATPDTPQHLGRNGGGSSRGWKTRVVDLGDRGWRTTVRRLLLRARPSSARPRAPIARLTVEIQRLDAHPGDLYGRELSVEVANGLLLSELLAQVVAPFVDAAPPATWIGRSKMRGEWVDWAEVVTDPADQQGARLLVADERLDALQEAPGAAFRVACRPGRT